MPCRNQCVSQTHTYIHMSVSIASKLLLAFGACDSPLARWSATGVPLAIYRPLAFNCWPFVICRLAISVYFWIIDVVSGCCCLFASVYLVICCTFAAFICSYMPAVCLHTARCKMFSQTLVAWNVTIVIFLFTVTKCLPYSWNVIALMFYLIY